MRGIFSLGCFGGARVREISGHAGRYLVSDAGEVYTVRDGIPFVLTKVNGGRYVNLYRNGAMAQLLVSYLVARAFLPNPAGRPYVCHRDGDPTNNRVDNLFWSETKDGVVCGGSRRKVVRYDADGCNPVVFDSVSAAADASGVSRPVVQNCLAGRRDSVGGWIFMYKTEKQR